MKASVLTENLQEHLSLVGKVIPAHSSVPVLSSILLEATKEGILLSATDLEFGITITVPAKVEEEGGVLIPGKQFIEVVNSLGHEKALIYQEKDQIHLEAQTGKFTFQGVPKDEFPKMFEEKGVVVEEFTREEFVAIFSRLTFAVSTDDARPHLTGVYMTEKDSETHFVATDGYRLSLVSSKQKEVGEGFSGGIIISPQLINDALSLKTTSKITMYTYIQGNQVILETDGVSLIGRLIEGTYPEYTRVIPEGSTTSITVSVEDFQKAVRAISVFARENANVVSIKVVDNTLVLSVPSTSIGEAESIVEGVQEGPGGNISFNIKYLSDLLRVAISKTITMGIQSPFDPAIFTVSQEKEFLHVIMPVRVQE